MPPNAAFSRNRPRRQLLQLLLNFQKYPGCGQEMHQRRATWPINMYCVQCQGTFTDIQKYIYIEPAPLIEVMSDDIKYTIWLYLPLKTWLEWSDFFWSLNLRQSPFVGRNLKHSCHQMVFFWQILRHSWASTWNQSADNTKFVHKGVSQPCWRCLETGLKGDGQPGVGGSGGWDASEIHPSRNVSFMVTIWVKP